MKENSSNLQMTKYGLSQALSKGLKEGKDQFEEELALSISRLSSDIKETALSNYPLILEKKLQMETFSASNRQIGNDFSRLSTMIALFTKRMMYSEEKLSEIDRAKKNIALMKSTLSEMKVAFESFKKALFYVTHGQLISAISIIERLDSQQVSSKIKVKEFSMVYSFLRTKTIEALEKYFYMLTF